MYQLWIEDEVLPNPSRLWGGIALICDGNQDLGGRWRKEYGFTTIDYLYYKRRDSLVQIQLDADVMEMLNENERTKNVSLFVTRQRMAIISPTKSARNKTKGDGNDCNQLGQPIGKEGGLLGQFLGTIARNGGYCPIDVNDWRKVKKDSAETILQCIQTKFLYPHSCEKWILKSIGRDWRKYKATLKKKLFNPKKKKSTLYKLCPNDIDKDQWKALIRYWKSTKAKDLSDKNKRSREMKKTTHTVGTKSYARWFEDLMQLENIIDKQPELAQNSEGRVAWEGDALHQILGEEKPGQVHGMGLLPDIDIATIDGSSSGVETHMLEEIKQLKEHARNQDKLIEELIDKKRHQDDDGPTTKANCISIDHGNFQQPAVHRKVGSTVLLKTANYPKKTTVAYATILSSSPKANVVHINHPTVQDEPLVRPMTGCETIGDAHAKGTPIAWPSICVC
ncbi:hypothetical protein PVAP13_9NG425456 [Panicum virgatum]|uniref:Transposase n=1 Tax=Panicum virgatum TaxID=38727 RepID=A0A8T0MMM3_PANVG|nr:hypothetical protein PVAP13_9NG425456 [Panicum virgatum]